MLDKITETEQQRVAALVGQVLAQAGRTADLAPEQRLVDAGLTSMDLVHLMLAVEAEFDLTIPAADITPANFQSVATVAALVTRVRAAAA